MVDDLCYLSSVVANIGGNKKDTIGKANVVLEDLKAVRGMSGKQTTWHPKQNTMAQGTGLVPSCTGLETWSMTVNMKRLEVACHKY